MAQIRKPIPKTPAERVQEKIEPYDLVDYGKEPAVSKNRATKVSSKDSRTKDFSVKLIDLDTAVLNHIKENIKPTIYQNTELIEVPVIYAYPERWVAMQKDGYLRDVNGKILTPVIVVNRTNIEKVRTIGRNLDGNVAQNLHIFQQAYTTKNAYDNFGILNNRQPVKEFKMVAHPDYVNITYDLTIYTNFVEQLNRIIESIQYAENSYWGDKNRYYFRVNANSFSTVNSYTVDEERTVTSKITLTLHGYLIPDTVNAFMSHEMNFVSKGTVKFNEGYIGTSFTIPASGKTKIITQTQSQPGTSNIPPDYTLVINYLNTNTTGQAEVVSTNLAYLRNKTILAAPPSLTPTSKINFIVYVNGVAVDSTLFEIVQEGSDIKITFSVGSSVIVGDYVTVIGKYV
jgi:hypothetical protein